ncbi:MAG: transposase [Oleiphilaceae bacterium]|jgi:transposase
MKIFIQPTAVYLHRDPVDFRKQIDGLAAIVELTMKESLSSGALFVFCSKQRNRHLVRQQESAPILAALKQWLDKSLKHPVKSAKLTKALTY